MKASQAGLPGPLELLHYANRTRETLLGQAPEQAWEQATTRDVSKVVLILSSSRGGSSLLFELLKQTGQLLCPDGEHTPILKLNRFGYPDREIDSDLAPAEAIPERRFRALSRDILSSLRQGPETTEFDFHTYALHLAARLVLQWPQLGLPADEWMKNLDSARQKFRQKQARWDSALFLREVLEVLKTDGHQVHPGYYDALQPPDADRSRQENGPEGPPCESGCIEETPFILAGPRRLPGAAEIKTRPVLLKASVDAYRVPFMKRMFPNAQFKLLHLTRNPAASINGLYDGWRYGRGFFSHNLADTGRLSIAGYSDCFAWGTCWWNFDLPPRWKAQIDRPLEFVCGFQWHSAHTSILESTSIEEPGNVLRIRFEDLIGPAQQKQETIHKVLDFIGIAFDPAIEKAAAHMPLVMVTWQPRQQRWMTRQEMLWPVIHQKDILALSAQLGYAVDEMEAWL